MQKNKSVLYLVFKVIITTIFSITIFLDSILAFVQNIRASYTEIYFSNIKLQNILVFIGTWILTFLILTAIEFIISKIEEKLYKEKKDGKKKKRVFFIIFSIIILLWMPFILSYFPGGIFSDTQDSIKQCLHMKPYNNINPLLYTLLIKVCLKIGDIFNSQQLAINVFGICQITIMGLIVSYFVYWLYKKNFSNVIVVITTLFFGCFKLIPMYALSIWKDTPFCLALFLYIMFIAEIVYEKGNNISNIWTILKNIVLIIAVSFLRGNGLYVAFATTLILILTYRKSKILKFAISSLLVFIMIFIIKGPVFTRLGINDQADGFNAIMIHQIFYVEVNDGNITDGQREILKPMCQEEKLKEVYSPILLDATTITPEFNNGYIVEHGKEIKKLWLELLMQNPDLYIKSYLLNTLGFWDVNKVFVDAYMSDFMWPETENIINVKQTDYIEKVTGHSIKNNIKIVKLYSSAIFLFMMLFSMLFTIKKKRYKNLIIYLPALFTWGTIMLATPIAFSLRYVYILVLIIPFDFIIPFLYKEDETKNEKQGA